MSSFSNSPSSEDLALLCAPAGKFRVLQWSKPDSRYEFVEDNASLEAATFRADALEGLTSQGYVVNDQGTIVHHGPTRSDLDQ